MRDVYGLGVKVFSVGELHRSDRGGRIRRAALALKRDAPLRYVGRLIPDSETYLFTLAEREKAQAVVHLDNYWIMYVGRLAVTEVMHVHQVDGWSAALTSPTGWLAAVKQSEEVRRIRRAEARAYRSLTAVTATSADESHRLETLYGRKVEAIVPSGVDLGKHTVRYDQSGLVLWVGSLSYGPNVMGLSRFLSYIWPIIRRSTGATFLVVGANPPKRLVTPNHDGVRFCGFVEDLDDVTKVASVGVVPLWEGAGVKLKTVTLMASGLPVVTTPVGIEGLDDLPSSAVHVAEDDQAFATAVITLLNSSVLRSQMGMAGRGYVEANLTWELVGARFVKVINDVLARRFRTVQ
jgi:glycosyltransferase involved in cell wall biosynthesis